MTTYTSKTRLITCFIYPNANSLDISGPLQVFSTANRLLESKSPNSSTSYYQQRTISLNASPVATAAGIDILPNYTLANTPNHIDTLLITGGAQAQEVAQNTELQQWLKQRRHTTRRIASVCTGAFILAAAGLLEQRQATTHWQWAEQLAKQYPNIKVSNDAIFTQDDTIYCSAGVSAGIDLALALVEEDWGRELALEVAKQMVVFLKRPGGQSQFSRLLEIQACDDSPIAPIQRWILDNLNQHLPVERLADKAAMSPRHFSRVFHKTTGLTPGKFILHARLDLAKNLLETTSLPLTSLAKQSGLGCSETLRRLFWQHFNTSPSAYRERFSRAINLSMK